MDHNYEDHSTSKPNSVRRFCKFLLFVVITTAIGSLVVLSRTMSMSMDLESISPTNLLPKITKKPKQPHIIFILADDLGWNDVGYHGSFINTPTIDHLASEGVKLENYYVAPICTPSRSALLSGKYMIHTGLQHLHIEPNQPNALTINATILPEVLSHYGYKNYMIGKWHLGFYAKEYIPTNRGFDKFFGIYPGQANHYNREHVGKYTLVENNEPVWDNVTYSTHLYINTAQRYIKEHMKSYPKKPLFLFLSLQAPHAPLQVPSYYSDPYSKLTKNSYRALLAGMVTCMDEGIKNLTKFMKKEGLWKDTITIFSTDNGGSAMHGSSNYPLRGNKGELYQGGVRGVAFITGDAIKNRGRVSKDLMHITDWYPTIVNLAKKKFIGPRLRKINETMTFETIKREKRETKRKNIEPIKTDKNNTLKSKDENEKKVDKNSNKKTKENDSTKKTKENDATKKKEGNDAKKKTKENDTTKKTKENDATKKTKEKDDTKKKRDNDAKKKTKDNDDKKIRKDKNDIKKKNENDAKKNTDSEDDEHDIGLYKKYLKTLDGYDVWKTISEGAPSPRKEILLNIDPRTPPWGESLYPDIYDSRLRSGLIMWPWKLLTGFVDWPFSQSWLVPSKFMDPILHKPHNIRLFNLEEDYQEKKDLFHEKPEIVKQMLERLAYYYNTSVPVRYPWFDNNWSPPRLHNVMLPWR